VVNGGRTGIPVLKSSKQATEKLSVRARLFAKTARGMTKKRTSGAKALILSILYGTAKPVPFVQSSFFLAGKAAVILRLSSKSTQQVSF
jgi:hypothetical protein